MPSQLLPAAQQPTLNRPIADCRIYERESCALPTTCQPASALEMKEMRWAATIADISQGGIRIVLQRRFERGTGLAVELPGDDERESTVVFVKVIHVRAQENGTWALGCKFISELSDDEMQRLLTSTNHVLSSLKKQHLDEEEDRQEPKATLSQPENKFLTEVLLLVETQRGAFREYAVKRLNVTKCWPLTAGKILSLRGKTRNQSPWSLRIRVLECRQQGKGWHVQGRLVVPTTAK